MLSKIDELKLVARCSLLDDRQAFGRLVEEYQSDIRRFFINLSGGDVALSDDLAQETFIKAYTGIRGFKGLSKFRTWLFRIAYNEFYDWTRKRREVSESPSIAKSYGYEEAGRDNEDASNARMDLQEALKTLNNAERSVVILYYMEDKPIKEVAAITGLPEGTVKSHISRAKNKLAAFLSAN